MKEKTEKANCVHCMPPKESVPRWHCESDEGEGDCPLVLGIGGCRMQTKQHSD